MIARHGKNRTRPKWRIPNGIYATKTPQLKTWLPLFEEEDGLENREVAIKDFYRFWSNPNLKKIQLRGKLKLGGELYGYPGHPNGNQEITDYIISMTRLTHGKPCENRFNRDILRVETADGKTYFFNSDQFNLVYAVFLDDINNERELETIKHFYVHPDYREENLM